MIWLLVLVLLLFAVGGGIFLSKFLFIVVIVALVVARRVHKLCHATRFPAFAAGSNKRTLRAAVEAVADCLAGGGGDRGCAGESCEGCFGGDPSLV